MPSRRAPDDSLRFSFAVALLAATSAAACSSSSSGTGGSDSGSDVQTADATGDGPLTDAAACLLADAAGSTLDQTLLTLCSAYPMYQNFYEQSCGATVIVSRSGLDFSDTLYFDSSSGKELADVTDVSTATHCTVFEAGYVPPAGCSGPSTSLCVDGGADAGPPLDASDGAASDGAPGDAIATDAPRD